MEGGGGWGGGLHPRLDSQEGAVLGERVRDANFRIGDGARRPAETPHTSALARTHTHTHTHHSPHAHAPTQNKPPDPSPNAGPAAMARRKSGTGAPPPAAGRRPEARRTGPCTASVTPVLGR